MNILRELPHILHHCHNAKGDEAKIAGLVLVVLGFFMVPILIGVPVLIFGIFKILQGFGVIDE